MPLDVTIDNTQEFDLDAVPVNAKGDEVKAEEPVSFSVSSGDVQLVDAQPTRVTIRSGAIGDSVVMLSTPDGDPTDTVTVHVTEAPATRFAETVSAPRTKP